MRLVGASELFAGNGGQRRNCKDKQSVSSADGALSTNCFVVHVPLMKRNFLFSAVAKAMVDKVGV